MRGGQAEERGQHAALVSRSLRDAPVRLVRVCEREFGVQLDEGAEPVLLLGSGDRVLRKFDGAELSVAQPVSQLQGGGLGHHPTLCGAGAAESDSDCEWFPSGYIVITVLIIIWRAWKPNASPRLFDLESTHVKRQKSVTALVLGAAAALALASCSTGAPGGDSSGDRLSVVATTTQLTDFASEVGGDDIELTGLLAPGSSAHHFDPTPDDLLTLGKADVLIVNGAGLDEFIDSAIESSGFSGLVIDASDGVDLALAKEITLEANTGEAGEHDHADGEDHDATAEEEHAHEESAADEHAHDDGHDHAEEEQAEEAHSEEEHDHDHGDLNPHLWTSLTFAQGMVHEIAHGLGEADKANAEVYEERAHEYMDKLAVLDTWIGAQFERVPADQRVLVTGHDSLRYYLHDYDIAFAGSLLPSFEDNAEPSAAEIDALVESIKTSGVKAIFVESSLSPKLAETVAQEAGVQVIDAESLFVDSLGAEGSGAETYLSATEHNTRVILEAWGATVDPLPAELS